MGFVGDEDVCGDTGLVESLGNPAAALVGAEDDADLGSISPVA